MLLQQITEYLRLNPDFPDHEVYDVTEEFDGYDECAMFFSDLFVGFVNGRYYPSYDGVWTIEGFRTLKEAMDWAKKEIAA